MSTTETSSTPSSSSEAMSPAEAAYFQSGGQDTEALVQEYGGETGGDAALASQEPAGAPDSGLEPDADEGDDEIIIGADGKPRDAGGKFVPHAALHKERERHKATRQELEAIREKQARADERLAVLTELMGESGKPKPASAEAKEAKNALEEDPIDPEEDIFAAFKQVQRQNAELNKRMMERETNEKAKQAGDSVANAYRQDAVAFMGKTPDFKDAYVHLIEGMHKELEAMGVADEGERNRQIAAQEKAFVQQAMANKKSPSELLYHVAKTRGFVAGKQSAIATDGKAKLENIRRGQNAVVSLAKAGGNSGEGLTMDVLASMDEDEFSRVTSKLSKSQLRALMGG